MEKYTKYQVEDFATDEDFIRWVQSPDMKSETFWDEVKNQNPELKQKISEATYIVQSLTAEESSISKEKVQELWNNISHRKYKKSKVRYFNYWKWAAIAILLIGISTVIVQLNKMPEFQVSDLQIENVNEGQVIFSDGSIKSINEKDSEIEVRPNGEIVIENDTLLDKSSVDDEVKLTHVVMPYGKQSQLQLPDGSIVYVNSGSKLSFPVQFSDNKREIFLVGEAYLKVKSDQQKPFIVQTPEIEVIVTGTEFNVSAYSDDDFTQTVLVEGEVSVRKNGLLNKKVKIKPGEGVLFDRKSGEVTTELVNVEQFTSWISGYYRCENESIHGIVKKIERYYNCKISIEQNIAASFSGKLDLKDNVEIVLETLAFASSLELKGTDGNYLIIKSGK